VGQCRLSETEATPEFSHVGDFRNETNKTEIVYEVNYTESVTSWPSYLEHKSARFSQLDFLKDFCKKKGKRNKNRMWGEYRKCELDGQAYEIQQKKTFDQDLKTSVKNDKVLLLNAEKLPYCSVHA